MKKFLVSLLLLVHLALLPSCDDSVGSVAVIGTGDTTLDAALAIQATQEALKKKEELRLSKRKEASDLVHKHLEHLIGTEYVFGVTDCSWLVREAYKRAGFPVKHLSSRAMFSRWVKTETPYPALTLYFVGHVGVVTNDAHLLPKEKWEMIHASSSKGVERRVIGTQGGYWLKRYAITLIPPPLTGFSGDP